jgi:hypothetical protein
MSCRLNSKSEWRIREINSADSAFLAMRPTRPPRCSSAGVREVPGAGLLTRKDSGAVLETSPTTSPPQSTGAGAHIAATAHCPASTSRTRHICGSRRLWRCRRDLPWGSKSPKPSASVKRCDATTSRLAGRRMRAYNFTCVAISAAGERPLSSPRPSHPSLRSPASRSL